MKFKINKEHFSIGLRQVTNVVSSKPQMPVLNNVLIKAEQGRVMLTTTNLDLGIRCAIKADIDSEGEVTLPVKKLAEIINAMPQQEIVFECSDGQSAKIKSGSNTSRLAGIKSEDFPSLPSFVDQHTFEFSSSELSMMLRSVSYAQSTDENRYILNSVYFNFDADKLTLVATDGRRLALISREIKMGDSEASSIILPAKTVVELEKLLALGKNVKITFSERQAAFDIVLSDESEGKGLSGSIYLVSKIVEGSYPNYKQVIPKETDKRIKIDREQMLGVVQRVAISASEKQPSVRLKISENSLLVSATGNAGNEGSDEPIAIEYVGDEVQIGFNPVFLSSPLRSIAKDEIFFEFKDEMSPGVFKTLDNFICVIMPIRI